MSPAPATAPSGRSNLDMLLANRLGTDSETASKRPSKGRKGSSSGGGSNRGSGARFADVMPSSGGQTPAPVQTGRGGGAEQGTAGSRWANAPPSAGERSPKSAPPASSRHHQTFEGGSSKRGSSRGQKGSRGSKQARGHGARDSGPASPRTPPPATAVSVDEGFQRMRLSSPKHDSSVPLPQPTISILQNAPAESSGRRDWAAEDEEGDDSFSLAEWGISMPSASTASAAPLTAQSAATADQSSPRSPPAPASAPPVRELFPTSPPSNGASSATTTPKQPYAPTSHPASTPSQAKQPVGTQSKPAAAAQSTSTPPPAAKQPDTLAPPASTPRRNSSSSQSSSNGDTPQRRSPRLPGDDGKASVARVSRLLGGAGLALKGSPQRGGARQKDAPVQEQQAAQAAEAPASQAPSSAPQPPEQSMHGSSPAAETPQGPPPTAPKGPKANGQRHPRGPKHNQQQQQHRTRNAHAHPRSKKDAVDAAQTREELARSTSAAEKPQVKLPGHAQGAQPLGSAASRWA